MQIDHYAVVGNPVEHSLSPLIHTEFAKQTKQSLNYVKHCFPKDGFKAGIDALIQAGFRGVNVRIPFKLQAFEYATGLTSRAQLAKSVNTLCFKGDTILGDNTDGIGLINDLKYRLQWPLKNKHIVLLGAGGAAHGLAPALLNESIASLIILNRHKEKAVDLAKANQHLGIVQADSLNVDFIHADLIINTIPWTPLMIKQQLRFSLNASIYCYDTCYESAHLTPFLHWGSNQDVKQSSNGLGMLVEQAAESFRLWRNVRVDTKPVFELLANLR